MKKLRLYTYGLILLSAIGCSKSGTKALEKGDYYSAVMQATEKLTKDIDNAKATEVLPEAYRLASEDLLNAVSDAKNANEQFKWERVLEHYNKLNTMHNAIEKCMVCRRLIQTKSFFTETETTRETAAADRYAAGMALLKANNRESGRLAAGHFERILSFAPNHAEAKGRYEEAMDMGSYHVVVEQPSINSRMFQYSNAYFQDKIDEFLRTNRRMNKFIRFYSPAEATSVKLKADHIVRLEIVDFVVGQTNTNSNRSTITSKDSVKVGEATVDGKKVAVYNRVSAQLTRYDKTVLSKGVLLMQITDFNSNKVLFRDDLVGEYAWSTRWAAFNGDERALTKDEISLCRRREENPPPPQDLYVEFCRPIYDQVTSRIRRFYDKY